jgi:spore germination protein GerM
MNAGITTQVPSNLVINQANIQGHIALIDVSKELLQISLADRRIAVGQLVYAAAAMGATKGIQLSIEGAPFSLKLPTGATVRVITPAEMSFLKKG